MCCWFFGVCLQVFWNLLKRIREDIAIGVYKMCAICCCCRCSRRRVDKSDFHGNAAVSDNNYEYPSRREFKDDTYKNVNREAAESLLSSKQNGTFIIRPSTNSNAIGTLSVHQDGRIYHLPIRRRRDNFLALGSAKPNEKCFKDLNKLIDYYISNYLILYSDNKTSGTLLLPYNTKITDAVNNKRKGEKP